MIKIVISSTKEIYKELVSGADAVVEAMRPGTLSKLGLGYEVLKEINPKFLPLCKPQFREPHWSY